MSLTTVFRRFWQVNRKSPRKPAGRRLVIESLEQRALLSAVQTASLGLSTPIGPPPPAATATQHLTVADLPVAAQQIITATIAQEAKLTSSDGTADDNFGASVAISGNTVAVDGAGGVCVFTSSGAGGTNWTQVATLTPSDGSFGDGFGQSIAISGNTVVVGAWGDSEGPGAVYVFTEPATGWANMTQTAKLTPSDGTVNDDFGISVAISGNTIIVGGYGGAAYVFAEPTTGWANMTQTAKLTASDGDVGDLFGNLVSISGNTVVVGAQSIWPNQSSPGAAYLFSEPSSGWINMTQTAKLTASDALPDDGFGDSVSISGNTVVVGGSDAAYVFTEPDAGWANMTQTAELTVSPGSPGYSYSPVAISGDTIVVGATYVFSEPPTGWTNMTQTAELTPPAVSASSISSGSSAAISGDVVVVGTWFNSSIYNATERSTVYVFTKSGAAWTNMNQPATLTASDGADPNDLGDSVAIDGNTVVVGATDATVDGNYDVGAAYVFTESGGGWTNMTQIARLTASDGVVGDGFGCSVAISGNTIVVGASVYGDGPGAVYVFTEPATGWANMTQTAKLTPSNAAASKEQLPIFGNNNVSDDTYVGGDFGCSVAISGNTIVVGSSFVPSVMMEGIDHPGAAYIFTEPSTGWANMTQTAILTPPGNSYNFGGSVAISGNTIVVGSSVFEGDLFFTNGSPAAYIFTEPSTGWKNAKPTATLSPSGGAAYFSFGDSVAINGSTAVVGAPDSRQGDTFDMFGPGTAYVYAEPFSGWTNMTENARLTPSDGASGDNFGVSVSISGSTVVVGAPGGGVGATSPGAAYVFIEPAAGWANVTQTNKLTASDGVVDDGFGCSVALSGNSVVIGASGASNGVNVDQGAAYVFGMTIAAQPTITSPAIKSAKVGKKYTYQVQANAGAGQAISFSLGAAPFGMGINPATGLVTWVPNVFQAGSSSVTILARNRYGDATQQTFSISVSSGSTPSNAIPSANHDLFFVGPVFGNPVAGTSVGVNFATVKSNVVEQLSASSGVSLW